MEHALAFEVERANSYRLLSQAYHVPDERLATDLAAPHAVVARECAGLVGLAISARDLDSLRVDHARLFVGPFRLLAPPYGSVYLEHSDRLMGNSTVDVRRVYNEEGLEVSSQEVPDHVAIELEFAHFLSARAAQAILDSAAGDAVALAGKRKGFLAGHLGAWIGEFAANVTRHARTDFYAELARATEAFVLEDLAGLQAA
ncbi:MAG: TorD/DmsD family molecular chaperone [Planctomycetota bacterium]|jgi:TorA maturation chaperone TorD